MRAEVIDLHQAQRDVPPQRPGPRRRLLVLSRYGALGASSRLRMMQFLPLLEARGFEITVQPLIGDPALRERYGRGSHGAGALLRSYATRLRALAASGSFDVAWIEKEALPWLPASLERLLLRTRYVLDFDDAIFHGYDRHPSKLVRRLFGQRIDTLMRHAALVIAGNDYLAARAQAAGARRVETIPTVVDLDRYPAAGGPPPADPPRIAWIGSPSTLRYLRMLAGPLRELAARRDFRLRVIGGGPLSLPGVQVESLAWDEAREAALLQACSIGVMPLPDGPWERGKCGYKLVQYMACGMPVVASPVGANVSLVGGRDVGFLASDGEAWVDRLAALLDDRGLRDRLGRNGRRLVEREYSVQAQIERLSSLLHGVAA